MSLVDKINNNTRKVVFSGLISTAFLLGGCQQMRMNRQISIENERIMRENGIYSNSDSGFTNALVGAALGVKAGQLAAGGEFERVNAATALSNVAYGMSNQERAVQTAQAGRSEINQTVNVGGNTNSDAQISLPGESRKKYLFRSEEVEDVAQYRPIISKKWVDINGDERMQIEENFSKDSEEIYVGDKVYVSLAGGKEFAQYLKNPEYKKWSLDKEESDKFFFALEISIVNPSGKLIKKKTKDLAYAQIQRADVAFSIEREEVSEVGEYNVVWKLEHVIPRGLFSRREYDLGYIGKAHFNVKEK